MKDLPLPTEIRIPNIGYTIRTKEITILSQKKIMKLTSLLLIAVLWFATSCGSDDDDAVPNGAFNFSATIDGSGWEGAGNSRVDILPVVGAQTSIGAGNANGSAFALLIPLSYTPDVAFEISGA